MDKNDTTRVSVGSYINIWNLAWTSPDIYICPNEVNDIPSTDEISKIEETVESWSDDMESLTDEDWSEMAYKGKDELDILEEMLERLNLECLKSGFTCLSNRK